MPRPIEFDRSKALSDAMLLFWRQGYHKTSIRDLTDVTRLKPGSLYGAFRNKRALFLDALEHYSRSLRDAVDRILRNDEPPLQRIRAFFDQLLTETAHDADNKGCLLVNTLLETPAEDHEITRRAAEALRYVERTFTELLEEAKARGELADDVDCCKQAKLLMTGIFGLRVYAKMEPSEGELSSIIESLLEPLMRR